MVSEVSFLDIGLKHEPTGTNATGAECGMPPMAATDPMAFSDLRLHGKFEATHIVIHRQHDSRGVGSIAASFHSIW